MLLGLILGKDAAAGDLLDVYRLSLINDARMRAARSEYLAAREALPQAKGAYLPNIGLAYDHLETDQEILSAENEVFDSGKSSFPTDHYTLTLTQPIFRYDAWVQMRQASVAVKGALAKYTAAEQELMLRAASTYLDVLAANDALGFARAELRAVKRQLDLARKRMDVGLARVTDVHDAQARYESVRARVVEAENVLDDSFEAMRETTGQSGWVLEPLREEIDLAAPNPADLERWMVTAQAQNLDLEAQRYAVQVAREEVARQRAGHLPTLDFVANHTRHDTGGSLFGGGSDVVTNDLILRLNMPIYAGGQVDSRVREARYRFAQATDELDAQERAVRRETRVAYLGVMSGISKTRALKEAVVAQELALRAKRRGFEAGLNSNLDVLDAERDLHLARRDFAQARYDYLLNSLRLKQAAGNLTPQDLGNVAAMLDREAAPVSLGGPMNAAGADMSEQAFGGVGPAT
jgi:outer membrane protein